MDTGVTIVGLRVAEVFGPVWQGEGPATGRRAWFVRFGLCNLHCSWCDTPYTWDHTRYDLREQNPPWSLADIWADLAGARHTDLLVLTGGEPLIWAGHPDLRALCERWDGDIHIETNGTIAAPDWLTERLSGASVSAKLPGQGDPEHARIVPDVLHAWAATPYAFLKIVCITPTDVYAAADLADRFGFTNRLWIMPEGTDPITIVHRARQLAPAVTSVGAHLSLRQQVLLYGDKRGT